MAIDVCLSRYSWNTGAQVAIDVRLSHYSWNTSVSLLVFISSHSYTSFFDVLFIHPYAIPEYIWVPGHTFVWSKKIMRDH